MAGVVEGGHDLADAARALLHRDCGVAPAHVGADPPGVDDDREASALAPCRLAGAEAVVEGGLRIAVLSEAPRRAAAGAHHAGDEGDLPLLASQHRVHQRFGDLDRGLGVDAVDGGGAHAPAVDAGVVDEDVDGLVLEGVPKRALLRAVGHLEAVEVHVARDLAERARALRGAGRRVHPPTLARVPLDESEADSPARSDDRHGGHDRSPLFNRFRPGVGRAVRAIRPKFFGASLLHPVLAGRGSHAPAACIVIIMDDGAAIGGHLAMNETAGERAADGAAPPSHPPRPPHPPRRLGRRGFLGAAGALAFAWAGVARAAAHPDEMRRAMLEAIADTTTRTAASTGVAAIDPDVMAALDRVPRHEFVPRETADLAYENRPLPIGHGQTISQPYIVALMTHLLALSPHHRVLEIGAGSGYQAAVLAELVEAVHTIEIVPPLARQAAERLSRLGHDNVEVRLGDGYFGWPDAAPFDAIIVTAAASHVPPPLVAQLAPGGVLVIPVGEHFSVQMLLLVRKRADGEVSVRQILPVRFVPLTGGH